MSSERTSSERTDQGSESLPSLPVKKSIWSKAREVAALGTAGAAKTAEIGKQAIRGGQQAYTGSTLESFVNYLDGELEQLGAKKAIKDTSGAVVGKFDQVTGKRLVELLEQKLRAQDEYNDILATRLAEALDRIAKLEARSNEH